MPTIAFENAATTKSIDGTALGGTSQPLDMVDPNASPTATNDPTSGGPLNPTTTTTTKLVGAATTAPASSGAMAPAPTGTSALGNQAAQAIAIARGYLGTPYKWGGTGPLGFDCSGLIQYVYNKIGISLPRISAQQARAGSAVNKNAAQAGDLIWFDENGRNEGADHIAIYIGNGQILEAPHTGAVVRIRNLGAKENYGVTRVIGLTSSAANKPK